jgi:hypothetical protein
MTIYRPKKLNRKIRHYYKMIKIYKAQAKEANTEVKRIDKLLENIKQRFPNIDTNYIEV